MLTGHTSHQIGLDADIWLTPMPSHELSREDREEMSATNVVAADGKDVDPSVWTPAHVAVIRAAAEDPQVERIFVNAAIKKALCRDAGSNRAWLYKVRPWWNHTYHFHVRVRCPADNADCHGQPEASGGEDAEKNLTGGSRMPCSTLSRNRRGRRSHRSRWPICRPHAAKC